MPKSQQAPHAKFQSSCRPEIVNTFLFFAILWVNLWPAMDAATGSYRTDFWAEEAWPMPTQTVEIRRVDTTPAPIQRLVRNDTTPLSFTKFLLEKYPNSNTFGDVKSLQESHQQVTHVYRLGHDHKYGRTNNNLQAVTHALDMIFDSHGDPPNNKAIIAVEGWAATVLSRFFIDTEASLHAPQPTASELANMTRKERRELRNGSKNLIDEEWKRKLEQIPPHTLVHVDRLEALNLTEESGRVFEEIPARQAYYYTLEQTDTHTAAIQQSRRTAVWGNLLKSTRSHILVGYSLLQDYLMENFQTNKYIAIHARWMEGKCPSRVGELLPQDECYMEPDYIKDLIRFFNHTDLPIVFLWDGQREGLPERLASDPIIGPKFVRAEHLFEVPPGTEVQNDMMIALFSDVFIGTRVSTMATSIAMSRVVMGAKPESNLVFLQRLEEDGQAPEDEEYHSWHVCEDCLFVCKAEKSPLCGHQPISS